MATTRALVYDKNGPPAEVLRIASKQLPDPAKGEARVRFLLSPFNPADLLTVSGKYPAQVPERDGFGPQPVKIGGNEGLAVVEALGPETEGDVKVGDRVIMAKLQLGTWQSRANLPTSVLIPIPHIAKESSHKPITDESAATLGVNPCTAYRMLKDFIDVEKEKVTVVQNAGNSVVGSMVIQLCKSWGAKSINLVRSREPAEFEKLKSRLQSKGADYVYAYEDLADKDKLASIKQEIGEDNLPRLGINCVGGEVTTNMISLLGDSATLVTYGTITGQDFTVPTPYLVFKNFVSRGFWWSKWTQIHSKEERVALTHDLVALIEEGKLEAPEVHVAKISKDNSDEEATNKLREHLKKSQGGKTDAKLVLYVE